MLLKQRPFPNSTKPRITCYSNIIRNLDSLESTQLFTPERFKEIKDYVSEDKFGPVELKNGRFVPDWICHYDTGLMWGKWIAENGRGYYIEKVLEKFLTSEEITKINEQANSLVAKAQDDKKFAVARKVKASEWAGRVCWNDNYYESVDDFLDHAEIFYENEEDSPKYIWAVDEERPILNFDIDGIFERMINDTYEDFDYKDLKGREEFSVAITKLTEANKEIKLWICNEKIAVMMKE